MRIIDKIKKAFLSLIIMIGSWSTQSYGTQILYGPPEEMVSTKSYQSSNVADFWGEVGMIIALPIVMIVGIIVLLKRKKK